MFWTKTFFTRASSSESALPNKAHMIIIIYNMTVRFVVWYLNQVIDMAVELRYLAAFMRLLSNKLNLPFREKQFLVVDESKDVLRNFSTWSDLEDWV